MTNKILGVILAGGLSRRMGGADKTLLNIHGKPLVQQAAERLGPQVDKLVLNANGDPKRYDFLGLPILADVIDGYGGPLVGVLTALDYAKANGFTHVLSVAADTPLFPMDYAEKCQKALKADTHLVVAASGRQRHPVFALWSADLADDMRRALTEYDMRKIDVFTGHYNVEEATWDTSPFDPFFNVNTPEDIIRLRLILDGKMPADPPVNVRMPIAVLTEKRPSISPWGSDVWTPKDVVLDPPPLSEPKLIFSADKVEQWLLPAPDLVLHRSDVASYRYNLEGEGPQLFVALRPNEDESRYVVLVTAAPDEGQSMSEGEDQVEPLPMPVPVIRWTHEFCAMHPPAERFRKRKRDRLDAKQSFIPTHMREKMDGNQ